MKRALAFLLMGIVLMACEHVSQLKLDPEDAGVTIKVMVIDTGIAPIPQFKSFLSTRNKKEDLKDTNGHGTHVTGTILYGPTLKDKVCKEVKIYSCKFYGDDAQSTTADCFNRATKLKMSFVNLSGGGTEYLQEEDEAVLKFPGTIITSVGNADPIALDLFKTPFYPASFKYKNIIAVGNGLSWKKKNPSTNYGRKGMIWRNGKDLVSFGTTKNSYRMMSGSSQSAAIVTHELLKAECQRLRSTK